MNWEMTVICPECQKKSTHHDHHINDNMTIKIWCDCGYEFYVKLVCKPIPFYMDKLGYTTSKKVEEYYFSED